MKLQSGFAHVLVIVGVIVLLAGSLGVVLWKGFIEHRFDQTLVNSKNGSNGNDKDQISHDNSADIVIPSDWQSYVATGVSVTFRHPAEWEVFEKLGPTGKVDAFRFHDGSLESGHVFVTLLVFKNTTDRKVTTFCPVSLPDGMSGCEQFVTKHMAGVIWQYKATQEYSYSSYIGKDYFSFSTNSRVTTKDTFKKLLKSFVPTE